MDRIYATNGDIGRATQQRVVYYDGMEPGYNGLQGLVDALVAAEVFADEVVVEVLEWLPHVETLEEFEEPVTRQFADLITNLKQAAAD